MKLWMFLKEHMLQHPLQIVCEKDAVMTYEELVVYAEILAKKLSGEKICAIYCKSEMAAAMALLGCIAAGVAAVPLSARYGELHRKKIMQICNPSCLITDIEGDIGVYHITDSKCDLKNEQPALIMWTSGTTGTPKGAMLSDKGIIANVQDICKYFEMNDYDTILISRPLYHCAVLTGEFLTALVKGTKVVFCSEKFNPALLIELMKKEKITTFCSTPTLLNLLSQFIRGEDKMHLKYIVVSGECMSENVARRIKKSFRNTKIYHVYGLTEAGPRVSYMPPECFNKAPDRVGIPLKSVEVEVRDKNGNVLPKNSRGILWVSGPNIMIGYYNATELSKQKLHNGWLCTGDIAEIDNNGWIKILGRSDDLIIHAGMNIYPQEIEAELKKDMRTKEVLAYGYNAKPYGTQIGLKISGAFKNKDDVRTLCAKCLPPFEMPSKIEIVEEIEKNAAGKIIRRIGHA